MEVAGVTRGGIRRGTPGVGCRRSVATGYDKDWRHNGTVSLPEERTSDGGDGEGEH